MLSPKLHFILFIILCSVLNYSTLSASVVVLNGLSHIYQLNPGDYHRGEIRIKNTNKEAEKMVRVYGQDYLFHHSGETRYGVSANHERSNQNWINYSTSLLTLQPEQEISIYYDLTVPEINSLTGTYWSVIMLEAITDPVAAAGGGIQIQAQMRYAVQIATTVTETGKRDLKFLDVDLKKNENGQQVFQVNIENTGQHLLIPTLEVEIFAQSGLSIGKFIADKRKIYPTTSTRFFVVLPDLPKGDYQTILIADCSDEDVFGINVNISIDDE